MDRSGDGLEKGLVPLIKDWYDKERLRQQQGKKGRIKRELRRERKGTHREENKKNEARTEIHKIEHGGRSHEHVHVVDKFCQYVKNRVVIIS